MTLIMIIGFVIIVTLLSIAINKNIKTQSLLKIEPKVVLNENEVLNAVTYLPDYTILVLTKNKAEQVLPYLTYLRVNFSAGEKVPCVLILVAVRARRTFLLC